MHDPRKLEANVQKFLENNKQYVGKLLRATQPITMYSGTLVFNQDNKVTEFTDAEFEPVETEQVFMYLCDYVLNQSPVSSRSTHGVSMFLVGEKVLARNWVGSSFGVSGDWGDSIVLVNSDVEDAGKE